MTKPATVDPKLLEYATSTQARYIEAIKEHGSIRAASRALGVGKSAIQDSLGRLKKAAAVRGYAPEFDLQHAVAPGQVLRGASTLYRDGQPIMQWVKTRADDVAMAEIMRAGFEAMASELPRVKPVKAPKVTNAKLANLYTLTDSHVGMLAWHRENLAPNGDWDLSIAERVLAGCFEHMVNASPAARVGIVAQLGDFLHSDGLEAKTPTSGHILDQDGRFPKVVQAALRILRRVVDFALAKHERVVVLLAEGNHDLASSVWLRAMFKALYENEPRVEVIDSELPYYVYQHGKTMIAWHHGHLKKNDQLPLLFAAQFPKVWGDTEKRYAHVGHRHHVEEKEHAGMSVIQHSTLASRDAYAARGGWMSERQCTAITYHADFGQVCRNTVTPEMLEAA
ncbi:hypothetical protein [Massilia sp. DD77]|uniref:hypothetical protein n=1 Tax=Massilia sp. DD77 TaxID=3109349 RepID=UPI002FFF5FCC